MKTRYHKMKKHKCIIILDTGRIEIWEKELIDTISSCCDVKSFCMVKAGRKKIPFFYKPALVKLNDLSCLYPDIPLEKRSDYPDAGDIDFFFAFNKYFDRDVTFKKPVVYLDMGNPGGPVALFREFIRGDSFFNIRFSVCHENIHYLLTESKLKMDQCFFRKNTLFFKEQIPHICKSSIDLFMKSFPDKFLIPGIIYNPAGRTSIIYHFDLILCCMLLPLRLFKKTLDFFCYWEQWHIGIVEDDIEEIISSDFRIKNIKWLPQLKNYQFVADPFGIRYNGRLFIMAELWDSTDPKGKIVWSDESSSFSKWNILFDHKTHLSYPFLLKRGKRIYCLPESAESGDYVLYTAGDFPCTWNNGEILFSDFKMADASVLFYNNKYWLFAVKDNGDSAFELYIWFSDRINGGWAAHPLNPVKRDITSARPAGPPFVKNNILYRPAQDCSDSYGSRVAINRVEVLTETDYREEVAGIVKGFENSPYPDGMHTFSIIDDVVVVDAKRKIFTLFSYRILSYKIKRVLKKFF